MEKSKSKKIVTIILLVALILFICWFLIVYPLIDFNKKEERILDASKKYLEKNSRLLPNEGELTTVSARTLLIQKYLGSVKTTYGFDYCNLNDSWVKIKKKNGNYNYYVYLDCKKMKSSIDHEGPTIKLKGKDEIEIEKGSTYKDLGVESVIDNTDGKMNVNKVDITNNVNTKKIGTYIVKYSIKDSFENESTIERKVKVIQTLNKVVKNDTDKSNLYKGLDVNNYIEFSNMLFRIVGLNSDGSVKIVSSDNVGVVNYNDIDKWLNDYFYKHLTDKSKKYIVDGKFCSDKVDTNNINKVSSCKSNKKQNVGILSISDYNNSIKDGNSYLYTNNIAWTSDKKDNKEAWTTKNNYMGSGSKYMGFDNRYNFNIYPVINLKKNIKLTSGDGTGGNPYKFSTISKGNVGDKVNTRYTGEYVSYKGTNYRIIDAVDGYTKVISENVVLEHSVNYSDTKNGVAIYNPTKKGNVGYFIENEFQKYIKNDIFVKHEVDVPIYDKLATYSGKKNTKKYKVTLAAPNMYEMFSGTSNDIKNAYWLINSSKEKYRKYMVSDSNTVYYVSLPDTMNAGVRFTGYINKDVTILSGKGTKESPYILEK